MIRLASLYEDLTARMRELRHEHARVHASRRVVERALRDGEAYYGINTGFGALAQQAHRQPRRSSSCSTTCCLSHAVGLGEPVPRAIAKLMLELKVHSLSLGHSGISPHVFARLLDFAERGLVPAVPSKGSLGASGDLAPLAHMALPLIGKGRFWNLDGTGTVDAELVLREERLDARRARRQGRARADQRHAADERVRRLRRCTARSRW